MHYLRLNGLLEFLLRGAVEDKGIVSEARRAPTQGVILRLECLNAIHRDGQSLDKRTTSLHLLQLRALLLLVLELKADRQTVNSDAARLHVLNAERYVVVLIGIKRFVEPAHEPRCSKLSEPVLQVVCLPTLGITLQSLFQELFPLLVRFVGQLCKQGIDVCTSGQVDVFVTKSQQDVFLLLPTFLL